MNDTKNAGGCGCAGVCGGGMVRRDFLKLAGAGSAALLASRLPVMAGPFARADFDKLVPADKKLDPAWVKSLFARGEREILSGGDLKFVGMPIGGLCTGQVYLGGDGRLWHWDIFNRHLRTGAEHYKNPPPPDFPFEQGFAIRVGDDDVRTLDRAGFSDVTFRGEYPVGLVRYRDPGTPVEVSLEAFSPYIPLNTDDSSLPATVMNFTVRNTGSAAVTVEIGGWLQNPVCLYTGNEGGLLRRNRIKRTPGLAVLECTAEKPAGPVAAQRDDIVFEDFEQAAFEGWTVEGNAFGAAPVEKAKIPGYQGDVGGAGKRVVNSHATAPGDVVGARDDATGRLVSREFTIERHYVAFFIGGGNAPGQTGLNLVVDGKVVASATGRDDNRMRRDVLDVRPFAGRKARIEIVDAKKGAWGNIGVDHIVFTDVPGVSGPLEERHDYGSMALALLGAAGAESANASLPGDSAARQMFPGRVDVEKGATRPAGEKLIGSLARRFTLEPGAAAAVPFLLAWHFPNLTIAGVPNRVRYYAAKFDSAAAVVRYLAGDFNRLAGETRRWRDTWYDATLPFWFLDRTHLNTSILASSTCFRFKDGRFWAWEGVGCCPGTCGHVWQYAQAMGRLFPDLERDLRERTDFGLALKDDGAIHFRGENNNIPAIDAQAGAILRALREHQVSVDDAFLRRVWPGVKKAAGWLIAKDANGDGLIESNQHNTLDADWFGPVAWLSGMYVASLLAAAAMADEMGDADFAATCRDMAAKGQRNIVAQLFDGEYFINKVDPAHLTAINSGTGCEIDQVLGQSWAFQVGLPRAFPERETQSALRSLWKYNFTPDVGPYRERYKPGRWYAMAGEAGLLMCSFPRTDWDYAQAAGKGPEWAAGYFNECMNGFEYQVAGHMIWEGMLQEGLAVTRAVHDRYAASRRNPYNEVECGDHYARSMASYGVYLAACGFEYHGPKGHIGFAPRLTPEDFKCAFTAAEGWGTYRQKVDGDGPKSGFGARLEVKYGRVRLASLALELPEGHAGGYVRVTHGGTVVPSTHALAGRRLTVRLSKDVVVDSAAAIEVLVK